MLTIEKRYDEAASLYSHALAVNPGNAITHYNLGRFYLQFIGRPADALRNLRKYPRLCLGVPQAERCAS